MSTRVGRLLAACLFLSFSGAAQTETPETPEALNVKALQAYRAKDYAAFVAFEKRIFALTPGDPRALYNVASGEALLGHAAEAVAQLDQLVKLHIDLNAPKDPDFTGILKTPEWAQYQEHLAAMRKPVVTSSVAFTLADKGLLVTSVAQDQARGDVYIGSLRERKILKRSKDGVVSDFAGEKDGLLAVSSLLVDPGRNQLLAAMTALPVMQNYHKEDEGKSGILIFDLSTGKLVRSAWIPPSAEHHVLAQMTEDTRGDVFVVDAISSEVRRLRRSSSELELFLSSVVFQAPRGLALSEDERTLYLVDGATGIWAVDILSIDRTHVEAPPEFWMGGMVGLSRTPDGFISLQTGVQPNRLVRIRLDAKREKVTAVETLESNHPAYDGPMPGILSGDDFLYVANSQSDLIDSKTGIFAADKAKETVVLRLSVIH